MTKALHDVVPSHVFIKILDSLETREKARVATVSKAWKLLSDEDWQSIRLHFSSLQQLELQRRWQDSLSDRAAESVRHFHLFWVGGKLTHPAAGSLHIERFRNLESLQLKTPKSAYWALNAKAVACLAPLKKLKELVLAFSPCCKREETVTLEEFSALSSLVALSITLVPFRGWEPGWNVSLSTKLAGLRHLRSLCVHGIRSINQEATLLALVHELTELDLEMREEMPLVLSAPNLLSLRYMCPPASHLPFTGCSKLTSLTYGGTKLPAESIALFPCLESLWTGYALQCPNIAFVAQLTPLRRLCEVRIDFYNSKGGREDLAAFAEMELLEVLVLGVISSRTVTYEPAAALAKLSRLTDLTLEFRDINRQVILGPGFEHLQALRSLHVDITHTSVPLCSSSLRELTLEGVSGCQMARYPKLGNLPQLEKLQLKLLPGLEVADLLRQMAALPELCELSMIVGCYTRDAGYSLVKGAPEGDFERLLYGLRQLRGLKSLQLAAVNDDVSLNSTTMPHVDRLSLACRRLNICNSYDLFVCDAMDITFRQASEATLAVLDSCTKLSSYNDKAAGKVWRAVLQGHGLPALQFGEDLFDDVVDELRVVDLASHPLI